MTRAAQDFRPRRDRGALVCALGRRGAVPPERPDATPWTIVMPPPNVTGSLHIGHALDITLQDILTRHARMQGKDALWVVGTDHAGIATQMVVERKLESQGSKRTDIGREAFLDQVWEWKAQAAARSPASCAGSARRATGPTSASPWTRASRSAVIKVFVELYKRGLLYRDKRLVNWDPKFQTAICDLEVETRDVQGKFWHSAIRSPTAAAPSRSPPRGRRRCSPTWRSRSIRRRALQGADRQADQAPDHRPPDPDHRRRACRSRARLGRGQDHAGP